MLLTFKFVRQTKQIQINKETTILERILTIKKTPEFYKALKSNTNNFPSINQNNRQEILVVGRSNVGKSSLVNFLTNSNLAYVSKTPVF